MRTLLFVADGPLDEAILPPIVATILKCRVISEFWAWKNIRLHRGRGYERKLSYLLRSASSRELDGIVAIIDADKDKRRNRVKSLRDGRKKARSGGLNLPAAVGQAVPHGEAWLIADADAVKAGLRLAADHKIPSPAATPDPKSVLTDLYRESPLSAERRADVWADIARRVEPARCRHKKETGYGAFQRDLNAEFRSSET